MPTTQTEGLNALYTARAVLLDYFEDPTPYRGEVRSHTTIGSTISGTTRKASVLTLLDVVTCLYDNTNSFRGLHAKCSVTEHQRQNGWVWRFYSLTWTSDDEQWYLSRLSSNSSREIMERGYMTFSVTTRAPKIKLQRART